MEAARLYAVSRCVTSAHDLNVTLIPSLPDRPYLYHRCYCIIAVGAYTFHQIMFSLADSVVVHYRDVADGARQRYRVSYRVHFSLLAMPR